MDNSNQLQKSRTFKSSVMRMMRRTSLYSSTRKLAQRISDLMSFRRGKFLIIFCLFLAAFHLSCTRYYEEKSAIAVVETVLDYWAKGEYSNAKQYWVDQDQYKPLEYIEKFYNPHILDYKEKLSGVVQIYIDFKTEATYPSGGIWTFTVIQIDGHWKIKDYGVFSL